MNERTDGTGGATGASRFDPARRGPIDEDLRRAFSASEAPAAGESEFDAETIYRAAAGELPAAERLRLIDALPRDPELAEAWQLAVEMQAAARRAEGAVAPVLRIRKPRATFRPAWVALAAMLLIVVGIAVRRELEPEPTWRGQRVTHAIALLGGANAPLSRHSATLRWQFTDQQSSASATSATSARVVVTTLELEPVFTGEVATAGIIELRVPETAFAGFPAGTRLLWRVEARALDGTPLSSPIGVFVLTD